MKCPNCRLVNPDTALRCDCGYVFASETILGQNGQTDSALEEKPVVDVDRVHTLRPQFERKSTEKLLKIYKKRSGWWADEAYEAIRQILVERGMLAKSSTDEIAVCRTEAPQTYDSLSGKLPRFEKTMKSEEAGQQFNVEEAQKRIRKQYEVEGAKRRLLWSWVLLGVVVALVSTTNIEEIAIQKSLRSIVEIALIGYVVWASYWGIIRLIGFWLKQWQGMESHSAKMGCFVLFYMFLGFPFILIPGVVYGVVGGGVSEYLKYRRLAKTHS